MSALGSRIFRSPCVPNAPAATETPASSAPIATSPRARPGQLFNCGFNGLSETFTDSFPLIPVPPTSHGAQAMNTAEQVMDYQKTAMTTWSDLSVTTMTGVERWVALQLDVMRSLFDGSLEQTRRIGELNEPQDFLSVVGAMGKPMMDTIMSYQNESIQIIQSTGTGLSNILDQHWRGGATKMGSIAEGLTGGQNNEANAPFPFPLNSALQSIFGSVLKSPFASAFTAPFSRQFGEAFGGEKATAHTVPAANAPNAAAKSHSSECAPCCEEPFEQWAFRTASGHANPSPWHDGRLAPDASRVEMRRHVFRAPKRSSRIS
ncbi:MAG: phasin family protein [Betaproteobacteria bacterium]|nr:phasin family protein [Betaproteobacteria bacterium]